MALPENYDDIEWDDEVGDESEVDPALLHIPTEFLVCRAYTHQELVLTDRVNRKRDLWETHRVCQRCTREIHRIVKWSTCEKVFEKTAYDPAYYLPKGYGRLPKYKARQALRIRGYALTEEVRR